MDSLSFGLEAHRPPSLEAQAVWLDERVQAATVAVAEAQRAVDAAIAALRAATEQVLAEAMPW